MLRDVNTPRRCDVTKMAEGWMTFPLNLILNFVIILKRCYCHVMQTALGEVM